jgi:hypothetical protein
MSVNLNNQAFSNSALRNVDETRSLLEKLSEIFPNQIEKISNLLNQNPFQNDVNFFTYKLLDSI